MTEPASLLAGNATPWELTHELTDAARWAAFDAAAVSNVKDARFCPEHLLPVLAWERSVDLWFDDWSLETKRYVVHHWWEYERLKGKAAGHRRFVALAGGTVRRITAPPQAAYAADNLTDADYRTFLARYPQLRIYPFVANEEGRDGIWLDWSGDTEAAPEGVYEYADELYPTDTTAPDRYRREARLYDPADGSETVLDRREVTTVDAFGGTAYAYETVTLPSTAVGWYLDDVPVADLYAEIDDSAERTFSLAVARTYSAALGKAQYTTLTPSLAPIRVEPETVYQQSTADPAGFWLDAVYGDDAGLTEDTGWQRIYERTYLFDPARPIADLGSTDGGLFLDDTRLGMAPFTAELQVEIRGRRDVEAFDDFCFGFLLDAPEAPLDRICEAAEAAHSGRDTILLDTVTLRDARATDFLDLETYRYGDLVRA